jgi:hypothetical protein
MNSRGEKVFKRNESQTQYYLNQNTESALFAVPIGPIGDKLTL